MPRPIAFDLSRLYVGALGMTPRGIDRVDLGIARHLFDAPERCDVGIVPTLSGMGVVRACEAARIAALVERHWRETPRTSEDAGHAALREWLAGGRASLPERCRGRWPRPPWHLGGLVWPARWSGLRPAARRVAEDAVYLNTGQVLTGLPWCFRWLDSRPDVKPVFMLHDLIPLRFPEYAGPIMARHHARALATVARHARAMLATSHAVAGEIREALKVHGRADMPIHVVPLPVSPTLLGDDDAAAAPRAPYFVAVGVLDQRKNHRLLLHVWRDLVHRHGAAAPKLAILGSRGLRTAELHDLVARSPGLSAAVTVASGLPSAALREIVRGARGLLMPSFAEGFGLPLIEALALGVPVVASDIPAHREVGGATTILLDPLDGPGWRHAIMHLAREGRSMPAESKEAPQTWDRYLAAVLPFLESL